MLSVNFKKDKAPPYGKGGERSPQRRCIVTRETLPTDRLIRFVVGPNNTIVPDIEGRLPGRGLWLRATRDIVEKARAKNFFAKAARAQLSVDDDIVDRVEGLLLRRCLDILGLARRAGGAVAGFEKVKSLLADGKTAVLFLGRDGGEDGRRKVLSKAGDALVVDIFTSAELGSVFGRDRAVYAAVSAGALATRLLNEAGRLAGFRDARAV